MHTPLDRERHAAVSLREQVRTILGDDEQALADLVEGETNFNEVALSMAERAKELEAKAEVCANRIGELKAPQRADGTYRGEDPPRYRNSHARHRLEKAFRARRADCLSADRNAHR